MIANLNLFIKNVKVNVNKINLIIIKMIQKLNN